MNKKLILNKKIIATLDNPNRVFGGEGEAGHGPTHTCVTHCDTCIGASCVDTCATYGGEFTCPQPPTSVGVLCHKCDFEATRTV